MSSGELYKLATLDIATAAELNDQAIKGAGHLDQKGCDQVRVIASLALMTQDISPRQMAHLWGEMVYREMVRNRGK